MRREARDRLFYSTTLGWMMWNGSPRGLASGATLLLYDGSPFVEKGNILFDYADAEECDLGTSAKFIDALFKAAWNRRNAPPRARVHRALDRLTLAPEGFDYSTGRSSATCASPRSRRPPTSAGAFVLGNPDPAGVARRNPVPSPRPQIEVFDENRPLG